MQEYRVALNFYALDLSIKDDEGDVDDEFSEFTKYLDKGELFTSEGPAEFSGDILESANLVWAEVSFMNSFNRISSFM